MAGGGHGSGLNFGAALVYFISAVLLESGLFLVLKEVTIIISERTGWTPWYDVTPEYKFGAWLIGCTVLAGIPLVAFFSGLHKPKGGH